MGKTSPIYSMTGFGKGESSAKGCRVSAEIKSVNNRFFELQLRGYPVSAGLESKITQMVRSAIDRGTLSLSLNVTDTGRETPAPNINQSLVRAYKKAFEDLSRELKLKDKPTTAFLLSLPDAVRVQPRSEVTPVLENGILEAAQKAIDSLNTMRAKEGAALRKDLLERNSRIETVAGQIEKDAPQRNILYRERLEKKAADLFREGLDESLKGRLLMEIMLMADKADISEEITRLRSHCQQFAEALNNGGAVGKKLNFLQQELTRESNTVSSKSSHEGITRLALEIKEESEKMREQIQNLE